MANSDLIGGSPRVHARVAAVAGIVMLAGGTFASRVATTLIVREQPETTARNLVAQEGLLRLGIAGSLVMMLAFLGYGLMLYGLLRPVGRGLARLMLGPVLVSVPIYMLAQGSLLAALLWARAQRPDQMALALEQHRFGCLVAGIFFGLWLFPLGLLVYRSGVLPRLLGALLMLGSPGYVVLFIQAFFFPGSEKTLWTNPLLLVAHASELAMLLWLLIQGPAERRIPT